MEVPELEVAYENRRNHSRKAKGALRDPGAAVHPRQDRAACLSALRHILPVLKEPWTPQTCPLYRHMGDGDPTALAQFLYDRITEDVAHSEEFAFFRGSPEYEQLRPLLKETPDAGE